MRESIPGKVHVDDRGSLRKVEAVILVNHHYKYLIATSLVYLTTH